MEGDVMKGDWMWELDKLMLVSDVLRCSMMVRALQLTQAMSQIGVQRIGEDHDEGGEATIKL